MNRAFRPVLWAVLFGSSSLALANAAQAQQTGERLPALRQQVMQRLLENHRAAFVGRVVEVGGASFADVPDDRVTVVLRVSSVFVAPPRGSLESGDLVTIAAKDLSLLVQGRYALVFADPWITGRGVALSQAGCEVFDEKPSATALEILRREITAALASLKREALAQQLESAEMVFSCEVTEVRDPAPGTIPPGGISEHAPLWREAIVRVSEGFKGVEAGQILVIRFASSVDVAWRDAPKFTAGKSSFLMVRRDSTSKGAAMAIVNAQPVPVCLATESRQVLESPDLATIRELLEH